MFLSKTSLRSRFGGAARFFAEVRSVEELKDALVFARVRRVPWYVIGGGSNIVASDRGYRGVVVRIAMDECTIEGRRATVGAGHNLFSFIHKLNRAGLCGFERMAGIPGSVGGALFGNAGAYGQEIKDHCVAVTIFDGRNVRHVTKTGRAFGYRESVFKKHPEWIILSTEFSLRKGDPRVLKKTSRGIITLRKAKYRPGLLCPGSFFKNVVLADLPVSKQARLVRKVPEENIMYGKIPAGYLLEETGAKGMRRGKVRIARHHGNLFYNAGGGTAREVKVLARALKRRVKKEFGITLEEEVQYLPY